MAKKKIAITMGDPGGIGPEIIAKALVSERVCDIVLPVIIGNRAVMESALELTESDIELEDFRSQELPQGSNNKTFLLNIGTSADFRRRSPTREGGIVSVTCIKKALDLCLTKEVDAMVTAPISKEAMHRAGFPWPGHTEMIAELTGTKKAGMMFVGEKLKVILATIHLSLRSATEQISQQRVFDTIMLAVRGSEMLSLSSPRIAVAGLNPHAGEGGLFGEEEKVHILPAIKKARGAGLSVEGPYPPDVVFKKAFDGEYDIVVAMYHDQGLIPFKMLYFDTGVNATIGLPVIRTSPDHGTAYDIAWKGIASPASMIEAILLAERMNL